MKADKIAVSAPGK